MNKKCLSLLLSVITAFGCIALPACDININGPSGITQNGSANSSFTSSETSTTEESKTQISWDSPIVQNGIGLTINAITQEYIEPRLGSGSIVDKTKLHQIPLYQYNLKKTDSSFYEGESIEKYYRSFSKSINRKTTQSANAEVSVPGLFSVGVEKSFSNCLDYKNDQETKVYEKEYYCTQSIKIYSHRLAIEGYRDTTTFTGILTDNFLLAAKNIQSGIDAQNFFNVYGTHLITDAYFGGSLDISYNIVTNSSTFSKETKTTISTALKTGVEANIPIEGVDLGVGGSTGLESNNESGEVQELEKSAFTSELNISAKGGKNFSAVSFNNLKALEGVKDQVGEWVDSVNDNLVMVDVADYSLISVWEILPSTSEYETAKKELINYFKSECSTKYANMLDVFAVGPNPNFGGGTGTSVDPYLITNHQEFKNIATEMDASFKLTQDIDLGNWTPLGTVQWKHTAQDDNPEDPFKGTLDGNGYTLTYYSTVTNIDSANDGAWGLFGSSNGATFKNIKLNATIYSCPEDGGEKIDAFEFCMGGLVGLSINSDFDKCELLNGSIISNKLTDRAWVKPGGTWYFGATYTGGLVGDARNGWFTNCINNGCVTSYGYTCFAGGMVGNSYGATIAQSCKNNGEVSATHKVSAYKIGFTFWGESGTGELVGKSGKPYLTPNGEIIT